MNLEWLPKLRERIQLAKKVLINYFIFIYTFVKIFTQSFVVSQTSKEKQWLEQNANECDLELDEYLAGKNYNNNNNFSNFIR